MKRLCLAVATQRAPPLAAIVPLASANVPGVQITSRPANPTTSTSATFEFVNSLDAGASFECQLDGVRVLPLPHSLHRRHARRRVAYVRRPGR